MRSGTSCPHGENRLTIPVAAPVVATGNLRRIEIVFCRCGNRSMAKATSSPPVSWKGVPPLGGHVSVRSRVERRGREGFYSVDTLIIFIDPARARGLHFSGL